MRSLFAAIVAFPAALIACVSSAPGPDARALVKAGAPIVDVRGADEWAEGHIDKSTLIPLPEFEARVAEVAALVGGDKTKPVIVVCRSGARSEKARAILLKKGFTNVVNGGGWTNLR